MYYLIGDPGTYIQAARRMQLRLLARFELPIRDKLQRMFYDLITFAT